jgi:hypothetical protein
MWHVPNVLVCNTRVSLLLQSLAREAGKSIFGLQNNFWQHAMNPSEQPSSI